jgi:trimeric autotransporter adhesin
MRRRSAGLAILAVFFASLSFAQTVPSTGTAGVPPVIRFTGTLAVAPGRVPVTFGLYQHDTGGDPLWSETQTLMVDAAGRYAVVLGLATALPTGLFASGEARWLDVAVEGVASEPRRLLVSVPYALKAADAETVGGKPLSAFVLAGEKTGVGADGLTYVDARVLASALGGSGAAGGPPSPLGGFGAAGGAGSANYIGVFSDATTLVNSVVYQTPGGSIGVNTATPMAGFHAVSGVSPTAYFDVYSNALSALPVVYRTARGTPSVPSAVQANDILGGLAVRGYGSTGFSAGRGQVMYKAAENWTDTAQGTYLQFTTTPTGATGWLERIRVTPDGNVGIGTSTPAQKLSVAGTIESLTGGVRFPDGTTQTTAAISTANNAAFGTDSLHGNTTGYENSAFGAYSLTWNTTGSSNSAFGFASLVRNTTGGGNSAFGADTLQQNSTGFFNSAFGDQALFSNTTGSSNAAFGHYGLYENTIGSQNSAFGTVSMAANTEGSLNSAFGYASLRYNTTGIQNTAVGHQSLRDNTTGTRNAASGYMSLASNTTGQYNSAYGAYSLLSSQATSYNNAFGYYSLAATTMGEANNAFGYRSLRSNIVGASNSAFGHDSLYANVSGSGNSAFGFQSLTAGTGDRNSAFGYQALGGVTTGLRNTAVGSSAGAGVVTGSDNTFVGFSAGAGVGHPDLVNATAIGANALVSQNNSLVLGDDAVSVGIGTSTPNTKLQVLGNIRVGTTGGFGCLQRFDGAALAGTCSSDLRLKTNVQPFGRVLARVARLQPVHFTWRTAEFPEYHFGAATNSGLIAQDVEQVFPELVSTDERGYKMVNYSELPYLTLQAVKELHAQAQIKDAAVNELKAENDALKAQLAALAERLSKLEKR